MKKIIFIITVSALLLNYILCGKKQKEPEPGPAAEEVLQLSEKIEAEVELPQTQWTQSLVVRPALSLEEKEVDPFHSIFTQSLYDRIAENTSLKTTLSTPSSVQEKEDYELVTSVQKEHGALTAEVSVKDLHNDSTIFKKRYQSKTDSIFSLVEHISAELPAEIVSQDSVFKSTPSPKVSEKLLNEYGKAVSLYQKNTHENTDQAVKIFKNILRQDSSFVLAYTGLARCYLQIVYQGWDRNLVWLRLAQETARKALQKGESADLHLIQGKVYLKFGDYKKAEEHFRKAVKTNPNLAEAWAGLGNVYNFYGLYNPSITSFSNALDLHPLDIESRISLSMLQTGLRKYKESLQTIQKGLDQYPDKLFFHSFLGLIRLYQNDPGQAEQEIKIGLNSDQYTVFSHAVSAMIQARKGNQDQALAGVELEVKPYVNNNASLATAVAAVYALLGRNGLAVQWIQKAHEYGFKEYLWLANDPHYDNLRDDQRFIAIMDTIKTEWKRNLENYKSL
ncbi:MAG: tetratricopeptide repeat protein [bacterium]